MRSPLRACLILIGILLSSQALGASPPKRPKVAVLELEPVQGVAVGTAKILSGLLTGRVSELGTYEVISSADIATMISHERQRQLVGCSEDTGCLAEVGGALGVDLLLSGQVGKIGTRYSLNLALADVRKARVVSRQALLCEASDDVLVDVAQKAVKALFQPLLTGEPAAAPVAATPEVKKVASGPSYLAPGLTTALTAALLGGALYCGITAQQSYDGLADFKRSHPESFAAKWQEEAPGIRQRALAADILYGATAVAAGITIWLYVRSASSPSSAAPAVTFSADAHGGAVALSGTF